MQLNTKETLRLLETINAYDEQVIEWARVLEFASTEGGAPELAKAVREVIDSMVYNLSK